VTAPALALVLRADASHRLGAGHVMRLAALSDAARRSGGRTRMLIGGEPGGLIETLIAAGHDVAWRDPREDDRAEIARHAAAIHARTVVLDGPDLDAAMIEPLTAAGLNVAALDDGTARLRAPVIINPGFGAEERRDLYPFARLALLGRDYALLREVVLRWPRGGLVTRAPGALRVLITFGGSDPQGATPRAVRALIGAAPADVVVVWGGSARHGDALIAAAAAARDAGHLVECSGPVDDLPALMACCDLAICGAGGTLAELAYLGRAAAAYAVAPDQVALAAAQAAAGLAHGGLDLAVTDDDALRASVHAFLADSAARAAMAARATATCDGRGAMRVLAALT